MGEKKDKNFINLKCSTDYISVGVRHFVIGHFVLDAISCPLSEAQAADVIVDLEHLVYE